MLLDWARGSGGWNLPKHATALRAPLPPLPPTFSLAASWGSGGGGGGGGDGGSGGGHDGGTVEGGHGGGRRSDGDDGKDARRVDDTDAGGAASFSPAAAISGNASLSRSLPSRLELVYVGPLNLWGGLALFCDALDVLLLGPKEARGSVTGKESGSGEGGGNGPLFGFGAVTFIGKDGPLAGFGGGVEGGRETGSEFIAARAKRWHPVGIRVMVNPSPPNVSADATAGGDDVDAASRSSRGAGGVWTAAAYVTAGAGMRLAVFPSPAQSASVFGAAMAATRAPLIAALTPGAKGLPLALAFDPRRRALVAKLRQWLALPHPSLHPSVGSSRIC